MRKLMYITAAPFVERPGIHHDYCVVSWNCQLLNSHPNVDNGKINMSEDRNNANHSGTTTCTILRVLSCIARPFLPY